MLSRLTPYLQASADLFLIILTGLFFLTALSFMVQTIYNGVEILVSVFQYITG
jgi:hypothetical protein